MILEFNRMIVVFERHRPGFFEVGNQSAGLGAKAARRDENHRNHRHEHQR